MKRATGKGKGNVDRGEKGGESEPGASATGRLNPSLTLQALTAKPRGEKGGESEPGASATG